MSSRAKAAAALASLGIVGLGWGTATANGQAVLALNPTDTTATTPATTPATDTSASADASTGSTSSGSTSTATGMYTDGTYTGTTVSHRYGSVTVTVTVTDGAITRVTENVVSDGDRKSNQINSRAVPVVRSAVVAANSANVSTVSGATYTTRAYLSSLQSALDQAGTR